MRIDSIDRKILRYLQEDAGLSMSALARLCDISTAKAWRRVEQLEQAGVILDHMVEIDPRAVGYALQVSLRVTLDKSQPNALDECLRAARDIAQVDQIQTLLGRVDIRLNVMARDLEHYQQIYREQILALPHIAEIEALMLVSELKNTPTLPV